MGKVLGAGLLIASGAACLVIGYKVGAPWKFAWYASGIVHGIVAGFVLPRKSSRCH